MDLTALQALVAVAETGSFSRAAESLFITQPAISKRIATLEQDIGVTLFDRLGRQVRLTEAGETLLISARRILADIATSREEVRTLSDDVSGKLRLATSHHVGIHRLPPVLKAFSQACPKVDLDLLFMDSEKAYSYVADGSIELAIVTLPEQAEMYSAPNEQLITNINWHDPLSIVCSADHALVKLKRVTPKELAKYPAVLPAVGTVTRTILFHALKPHGITIKTALETNYLETIKMMVSVGLGWSTLPKNMTDNTVVSLPVSAMTMQRELGSVRQKGRTLSRAANAFLNLLPEVEPE